MNPEVAQTRDPSPVEADSEQKRERDRPQKHQKQAQRIAKPSRDAAPAPRLRRLGDVLSLFLMLLGSITLALLLGVGVYWAWITRLSDLWARWIGPPPF